MSCHPSTIKCKNQKFFFIFYFVIVNIRSYSSPPNYLEANNQISSTSTTNPLTSYNIALHKIPSESQTYPNMNKNHSTPLSQCHKKNHSPPLQAYNLQFRHIYAQITHRAKGSPQNGAPTTNIMPHQTLSSNLSKVEMLQKLIPLLPYSSSFLIQ